ncbi:MAG: GGDEF domain-containing protein [Magnetococcales bacterium]|nr:GGDEF domain-containing protein [Magnetococcales bacterium]
MKSSKKKNPCPCNHHAIHRIHKLKKQLQRHEDELKRAQRIVHAVTGCTQALSQATSETDLFRHFCNHVVRKGGYRLAWIGVPHRDEARRVEPVAWAGAGNHYVQGLQVSWSERVEIGHGPTGRAVRTRVPQVCPSIPSDPTLHPWKARLIEMGLISSVALPVMDGDQVIAVLNLYADREQAFREGEVHYLTKVTEQIASGILAMREVRTRWQIDERNQRALTSRMAISSLLEMSLTPITLTQMLTSALETILAVPWLTVETKGAIFLMHDSGNHLYLAAQVKLPPALVENCRSIPLGHCLCGRVAETQQMLFTTQLDHRHESRFPGIKPHGHHILPILSRKRLLGVLNLFVPDGRILPEEEAEFLHATANTLAGIVERHHLESDLSKMARYDPLTGVLNRRAFLEECRREVVRGRRENRLCAVLFIDLDGFKQVNDTFGHQTGDALLIQSCQRIVECVRESDRVARLGGDEFCVLLVGFAHEEDVLVVARKIIHAMGQEFIISDQSCRIGCSIGVALYPLHDMDPNELLRKADLALYEVKRSGKNNASVYHPDLENRHSFTDRVG